MSERFEYIIHPNEKKFINEFLIILKSTKKFQDCPLENLFFFISNDHLYILSSNSIEKNPKTTTYLHATYNYVRIIKFLFGFAVRKS